MIEAFVGLVGGGKSFCSVRRMASYMALGRRVCTNILLVGYCERIKDLCPFSPVRDFLRTIGWNYQPGQYVFISFEDMVSSPEWFKRVPAGVDRDNRTLLIIDEATDLFDVLDRDKARADSVMRELFRFLRLSRHAHIDVLFICQALNAINNRLRDLVASIWRSTDMKNFRLGRLHVKFPFNVFMLQQFDRRGTMELKREWVRKDKRIFGMYTSEAFGGDVGVKWDGVAIDKAAGKFVAKGKGFPMWVKVCVVACLVFNACVLFCLMNPHGGLHVGGVVTNVVERVIVSNVVNGASEVERPLVPRAVKGSYEYGCAGARSWVDFDGWHLEVGSPCEWGVVVGIGESVVKVVDFAGGVTWLCPAAEGDAQKVAGPSLELGRSRLP